MLNCQSTRAQLSLLFSGSEGALVLLKAWVEVQVLATGRDPMHLPCPIDLPGMPHHTCLSHQHPSL